MDNALALKIALPRTIAPQPDAWGYIVKMLLYMSRDMVFLARDVLMSTRTMLPDVEVGDEEILGLVYRCVELDPLLGRLGRGTRYKWIDFRLV